MPTRPTAPTAPMRWLPWVALGMWLGAAVLGGLAVGSALDGRSAAVRAVALGGAWIGWAAAAAALAIASTVGLTVARAVVPVSVVAGAVTWVAGAPAGESSLLVLLGLLATLVVMSAEFGGAMVQASAYGDETRLGLRPPLGFLVATVATWALTGAALVSGPLLVAANVDGSTGPLVLGVVLTLAALLALWLFPRRWHLLSGRWLVFVPAGVVIHDRVVLAETVMLRRADVTGMHLAYAGTGALDLTGPATGHAVEIGVAAAVDVLVAARERGGSAQRIHATAMLVSPSRPGRALGEAESRRLPVTRG